MSIPIDHFLTKTNVILMWELIDENSLQYKSSDDIEEIKILFNNNLNSFFEKEKYKTKNVMEMNKKYISLILHYINDHYYNSQQNNLNVRTEPNVTETQKELITYEDLQTDRLSHFEKQLSLKQQEFSYAMQSKIPETPNFKDNIDEPMREMDITMQRTIAQRNYDIEQLNQSLNQKINWLEPMETSIKNENIKLNQVSSQNPNINQKIINPNTNQKIINPIQPNIKYIKIHKEEINSNLVNKDVIVLEEMNKHPRHITWEDQLNANPFNLSQPLKLRESIKEPIKEPIENNAKIMSKLEYITDAIQLINEKINSLNSKYINILEVIKKKKNK